MKTITRQCRWCLLSFVDAKARQGRPSRYCSSACSGDASWARRADRRGAEEDAAIEQALAQIAPPSAAKPFSWWVAQACLINETCRKCEGPVQGVYVPPTQANMGECAVVAHCRLCGTERMVIAGRSGVPYEEPQLLTEEELAKQRQRSEQGRQAALKRRWRPVRVQRGEGT